MSQTTSCVRCAVVLVAESPSGICEVCLSGNNESRAPKPLVHSSALVSNGQTASFREPLPAGVSPHEAGTVQTLIPGSTPPLRPRPPLPNAPHGYEILSDIGHGGMGDVYKAKEKVTGRIVAMKFVRAAYNSSAIERFLREVQSLTKLDHPNIVRVYTAQEQPVPFFTMDYHSGGSLAERIANNHPLDPSEAAQHILSAAIAIQVAHNSGIIHRDLKPSNMLLAADGTIRVSDFGLAKLMEDDGIYLTISGPLGTPGFMSPEQVSRQNGEIDPRSDVYGLGATLYQLLTGRPPFVGDSNIVIRQVESVTPDRPRHLRPEIPLQLEAIVMKCLEKKQADRYATADDLATDLERCLGGQNPEAPQLTPGRRLRRWALSHCRQFMILFGVLLAAFTMFWIASSRTAPIPIGSGADVARDPISHMRAELAANRPVTVVDEQGVCKFGHRKIVFGSGDFDSPEKPTAAFWARKDALLELCPDPGIDHYKVTLELRQLDSTGRREQKGFTAYPVGLYFGHDFSIEPDGTRIHTFLSFKYSDYAPPGVQRIRRGIDYQDNFILHPPLKLASTYQGGIGPGTPTTGVADLPGPWRRFEFVLSSDAVEVEYGEEPNKKPVRHSLNKEELKNHVAKLQRMLFEPQYAVHAGNVKLPEWSPRRPFGLYALGARVEAKNVVITPLTPAAN